jgi:hypothetical protein
MSVNVAPESTTGDAAVSDNAWGMGSPGDEKAGFDTKPYCYLIKVDRACHII